MTHIDQLVDLTYEFSRTVSRQWKDVFKEHGLSAAPLLILRQIYKEPGLTVSDIARRTNTAKSHVSRTVESFSRQGYVEKRPDPADQRVLRIHPTHEVAGGLEPLRSEIRQRLAKRLATLPEDEIPDLIKAIQTLQSILADHEGGN
jgi:DNA-binding MarR family transcriptional regulator